MVGDWKKAEMEERGELEKEREPMIQKSPAVVIRTNTHLESRFCSTKVKEWARRNLLLILTVVGVLMGVFIGFMARMTEYSEETVMLVSFPGDILMRMLKMLILPLIVSSLISGLCGLDAKSSGKMGSRALIYYFVTTMLAGITGIVVVLLIHPGNPEVKKMKKQENNERVKVLDAFLDIVRNMFPDNLIKATFEGVRTSYVRKENATSDEDFTRHIVHINGINVIGLIVFCVAFGLVAGQMRSSGQVLIEFFVVLNDCIMKMVELIMW
ncbi:unnamed protein product [Darwinula stevensoni]|nr:unnamed protein product [Darwinula stevensoni]CAG0879963.1 unnamed protein product [Darwinula stevensoni]